ncbi:Hint domain-containing protein, partial [Planktotalea arctica]|uniref:Hint domain-containing protein n=1 Tax=Planktotalea arctica TaxID=1481893 RepID=UPI0032190956
PGFEGIDTITYVVDDGNGSTVSAPVTVTVGTPPLNSPPVAVNDAPASTPLDTLLEDIDVLGNDSDPDGDPLTVTAATAPNGTVTINPDGTLDYQPDLGFTGDDTITYAITDSISGTDTATLVVTVGTANLDPNADPDTSSTTAGTPVTIFPLGNDSDPDGDPLTITSASAPDGTVTISADGTSVTYTPDLGFDDDVDSITYTISDGNGGSDTSSIQVIVGTPGLDGIVEGTGGDDLIDLGYLGDPDGDQIDNSDAIAPGAGAQDDVVEAGAGDDTIDSGLGDDFVTAGPGDDDITTGEGDDTVFGGLGLDTIDTGDGEDSVFSGDGDDSITTGDGSDTVLAGIGDDVIDTSGAIPLLDDAPFPSIPTDSDPEDDRDFVDADEGNDLITTGDDADTIFGGEGDDTINSGIDDDEVYGDGGDDLINDEQGSDFINAGAGDDTINAGIDTFSDYIGDDPNLPLTDSGITFVTDPDRDDGRDTVFGGAGNDIINTGDDADSIDGGADNDTINAGIDDDTVRGGLGDDSIFGGHGSDTISGGGGDDFIDAGHTGTPGYIGDVEDALELPGLELNDRDVVTGGAGNDTIFGGDDDDSIIGGQGNDFIDGGIDDDTLIASSGNDTVLGGSGDDLITGEGGLDSLVGGDGSDTIDGGGDSDTIIGGAGADSIFGGSGEDSIVGATAGDTIDGGEGPTDFDTLDLRGAGAAANVGGRTTIDYDAPGSEGGIVNFLDAADVLTGTARFDNIENVIPCFTPGTLIATPTGERKVEDLKAGDRVITRDNGIQEIRWSGSKDLSGAQLAANDHLQPILIRAGALGANLPERDILVSPQHRMLLTTDQAAMYFEEREVLVAAKHLTILDGVDRVTSSGTTYIHIMFEQHEVVLSNGTWSESFQPGDYTLDGIGKEQRDEILELFPELATQVGSEAYQAARRTLKKYEAALLLG